MKPANPLSLFFALLALSVVLVIVGTAVGSQGWEPLFFRSDGPRFAILWEIRLPRTAGAWLDAPMFFVDLAQQVFAMVEAVDRQLGR